ncbi:MAG: hypothetical protein ACKV0T_06810 [Planctomycetales bacterium]
MPLDWLKHAFAIDAAGPVEPTEAQRQLIDRLCRLVISRELTLPAQMLLETVRPLNFVTGQMLHFFAPLLATLGDSQAAGQLAEFLERRGAVDYLARRLEELQRPAKSSETPGSE